MIKTEEKIKKAFYKLLEKYNLDEIDVNMICKQVNVKRQTFYYHYRNIYDLIFSIYCNKKVGDFLDDDINSIVRTIFSYLFSDLEFNTLVAKSNANDVLREVIANYSSVCLMKILDRYNLRITDKKEISRFYSNALSSQCIYYFIQGDCSIKEGCLRTSFLFNEDILKTVIRKYQNSIL